MSDHTIVQESRELRAAIGRFETYRDWQQHPDGAQLTQRARRLLNTVRRYEAEDVRPGSALHVAHWNVLHGLAFDGILQRLKHDEILAGADLLSLNEVDLGLARTGNRDVAFDLARALRMHAVWAPLFLELQGGHLTAPTIQRAEQREALFGLALLSRYPLGRARRVELETPHEYLFGAERKVGAFIALIVDVLAPQPFTFVVTHLDVHASPEGRGRQILAVLKHAPQGDAVVCGDFNTTTFPRGTWLRTATTLATLALSARSRLDRRLQWPDGPYARPREPLFSALRQHGFEFASLNDRRASLDLRLRDTHEYAALPGWLRGMAGGLFRHVERRTGYRLDWIAARGFEADSDRPPYTRDAWMRGTEAVSDHAPIGCGLRRRDSTARMQV